MLKSLCQHIFIFSMLCMPAQLAGQPLTFRVLSLSEGLPQSQVTALMIDSKSYVWIGTKSGGLVRYDGAEFERITQQHGVAPQSAVICMYEHTDHAIYYGTENGLYIKSKSFRHHDQLTSRINVIQPYQDSLLLLGTTAGLAVYSPATQTHTSINHDDIGQVLSIHPGNTAHWIGTTSGLFKLNASSGQIDFVAKMLGQGIYDIKSLPDGKLCLASWNAGVILYNTTASAIDTVFRNQSLRLPQCLFIDSNIIWVGTQDNGLVAVDLSSNQLYTYGESEGLPHINVKAITKDRQGQWWIGTHGGGIAVGTKQNFRHYDRSDGLASNRVYGIATDVVYLTKTPGTWITAGDKFQLITSSGITTYDPDSLTHGVKCKSILRDPANRIWIGTEGRGVILMQDNRMRLINHLQGLSDPYVQQLAIDSQGQIFIATFTGGLFKMLESANASLEVVPISLPFKRITSLHIDADNRMWVGSFEGEIVCLHNEKIVTQSTSDSGLPNQPVKSIIINAQNKVWAGTENRGIWYANANDDTLHFTPLDLALNSNHIYVLLNDGKGNSWAGTEKGVNRIAIHQDGTIASVTSYGRNEGFTGIETTHNAATVDSQGHVWFGTMNGLMRYTSGEALQNKLPPVLHFEDIQLFYKSLSSTEYASKWNSTVGKLTENTVFTYDQNHLSFHFKAIDLLRPDDIQYRWKLEGIDQSWSPPTDQPNVNYAGLQAGTYTLSVQAATDTMLWSAPIVASFIIKPPYWKTTTFTILLIIALTAFLLASVYLWTYFVRRREKRKRQQLEAQNTILQLEQKALQLQMNPHFLFNALTSIKSMVNSAQLDEAQEEINAFAKLMRGVLNNSRKPLISLQEEIDVLEQYLHIEQVCHQHKFEYKIETDDSVDTAEIDLPPMLIQPFVENAVVHGVSHLKQQGMIRVRFSREGNVLVCEITDNGVGRERAATLRTEKKPGHQPVAMEVTMERLTVLKRKGTYVPLETKDILDVNGNVAGTQVIIRIPIENDWS